MIGVRSRKAARENGWVETKESKRSAKDIQKKYKTNTKDVPKERKKSLTSMSWDGLTRDVLMRMIPPEALRQRGHRRLRHDVYGVRRTRMHPPA